MNNPKMGGDQLEIERYITTKGRNMYNKALEAVAIAANPSRTSQERCDANRELRRLMGAINADIKNVRSRT